MLEGSENRQVSHTSTGTVGTVPQKTNDVRANKPHSGVTPTCADDVLFFYSTPPWLNRYKQVASLSSRR